MRMSNKAKHLAEVYNRYVKKGGKKSLEDFSAYYNAKKDIQLINQNNDFNILNGLKKGDSDYRDVNEYVDNEVIKNLDENGDWWNEMMDNRKDIPLIDRASRFFRNLKRKNNQKVAQYIRENNIEVLDPEKIDEPGYLNSETGKVEEISFKDNLKKKIKMPKIIQNIKDKIEQKTFDKQEEEEKQTSPVQKIPADKQSMADLQKELGVEVSKPALVESKKEVIGEKTVDTTGVNPYLEIEQDFVKDNSSLRGSLEARRNLLLQKQNLLTAKKPIEIKHKPKYKLWGPLDGIEYEGIIEVNDVNSHYYLAYANTETGEVVKISKGKVEKFSEEEYINIYVNELAFPKKTSISCN